ncbi:hypothetical protein PTUN_a0503 [Pseudoalteromonas tunicata]|nr:hypothetical protein PTUN_a0503 [Pseudoalteromonas tunicata]
MFYFVKAPSGAFFILAADLLKKNFQNPTCVLCFLNLIFAQ